MCLHGSAQLGLHTSKTAVKEVFTKVLENEKEEQMKFPWLVLTEDVQQSILLLTKGRGSICLTIDY